MLVAYDDRGRIVDFASLEVQAVYISGNVRRPYEHYMEDPANRANMDWTGQGNYPCPDYLSSSRKRLAPQLLYKGSIFKAWEKKQAVAIHQSFYNTLPQLPEAEKSRADIAWLIYDLQHDPTANSYQLINTQTVYTEFQAALEKISVPDVGFVTNFVEVIQEKLDEKLENENSPYF